MKISISFFFILFFLKSPLIADEFHNQKFDQNCVRGLSPCDGITEKILTTLKDSIDNLPDIHHDYKAEISYMFADIKLDAHGSVKILELGQGKNAGGKGHEHLYGKGEIWKTFWNYLVQFNKPIWFVGPNPHTNFAAYQRFAWETLKNSGGYFEPSLESLEHAVLFKQMSSSYHVLCPSNIDSYSGIIVFRRRDDCSIKQLKKLEKFRECHQDFLTLDRVSRPFAAHKALMSVLFKDSYLERYRPKSGLFLKKYYPELAQEIIRAFDCSYFVIKPLNSGKGNGIIMVQADQLDHTLKSILNQENGKEEVLRNQDTSHFNHAPKSAYTFAYWKKDKNESFIVEEFVCSKNIYVKNKAYDPTMRILFAVSFDRGKTSFKLLNTYWKLPRKSLHEVGTFTEKHKSKIYEQKRCSVKVTMSDERHVEHVLSPVMQAAFKKMIKIRYAIDTLHARF